MCSNIQPTCCSLLLGDLGLDSTDDTSICVVLQIYVERLVDD